MAGASGESFSISDDQLTFSAFILGLASSALIHLGAHPDPESGKVSVDLTLARQSIDVLSLLREKTRGNLTTEEDNLFGSILSDLQLRFIEKNKK